MKINPAKLRSIALDSQGLLKRNVFGKGKNACLKAIQHIGYVQIDTISVVERAHHQVLWSRVDNYQSGYLDKLVEERKIFEYWSHAAAWLPMEDYRFALPRMNMMNGDRNWFDNCDTKLIDHIVDRIKAEGPLRARDFEDDRKGKKEWWDWKPAKRALEQLFMQGDLMVSRREGFQKVYDLRENVLPEWVDTRVPTIEEYAAHLVGNNLRSHGLMTARSVAYLRKGSALRQAVVKYLEQKIESDELTRIELKNGREYYLAPEQLETRSPTSQARVKILSPFDNAVIQRERLNDLFAFDYQIECYVPEHLRQHGYFCLPLLYRDRLVGRIDCKAHRTEQRLHINFAYLEKKIDDAFYPAFAQAFQQFAQFNGCTEITSCDTDWVQTALRNL